MLIGLLGQCDEPQIRHLQRSIEATGNEAVVIDTSFFGITWQISFDPQVNDGAIHMASRDIAMSSFTSVYWHKTNQSVNPPAHNELRSIGDQISLLQSWLLFSGTHWVNSFTAIRNHQCKPAQLARAVNIGATIPHTYIGNHKHIAKAFIDKQSQALVKPVRGGQTAKLVAEDFGLELLAQPHTLQTFIDGTNIRSYVFGEDVCHIQIDTESIDFRDDACAYPQKFVGNQQLDTLCVRICRVFQMKWCAIDWRLSSDGEYVFLEANPAPYFLYAETCTGWDLTGRLLKLLLQR